MGCRKGYHRGIPKDAPMKYCVNHGEQNPDSKYPDWFCGKHYMWREKLPEYK